MDDEASKEIAGLLLWAGRPVKDEEWVDGEWRDFGWDHVEGDCPGWSMTDRSEVVEVPFECALLFTLTHCRCACRVFPLVTLGLEGTRG